MSATYLVISQPGDTVDELMYRHRCNQSLEAVMFINPKLAGLPVILPAGTPVLLPFNRAITQTPLINTTLNLWS